MVLFKSYETKRVRKDCGHAAAALLGLGPALRLLHLSSQGGAEMILTLNHILGSYYSLRYIP